MIVYTFQHQKVVEKIRKNGLHFLSWTDCETYSPFKHAHDCYRKMAQHLKYTHAPIWGFYSYDGKVIDDSWLEEFMDTCYHGHNQEHVLLKLDVPNEHVALTSYFDWSDFIFFTEENNPKMALLSWENVFDCSDADRIQILTEYIKKEWVLDVYQPQIKNNLK